MNQSINQSTIRLDVCNCWPTTCLLPEVAGKKKLLPPMRRIPRVDGWVTKKLMAMQVEVHNQSASE